MGTISDKLTYLNTTKSQLKDMINYGLDDDNKITSTTTFRNYVSSIFNAFLEALRTPDTLFTNLPKKSGTGANITLNDTANAPIRITLGATDITQDGTPTPDSPQDIHTISGDNTLKVNGKNLFKISGYSKTGWNITIDNPLKGMTAGKYSISAINNYITSGKGIAIYNANTVNAGINDRIGTLLTNYDFGSTTLTSENRNLTQEQLNSKYMIIAPTDNACTEQVLNNMQIMIEIGETATTYEPYISQEADIDLKSKNLLNTNLMVEFTPSSASWHSLDGVAGFYNADNIAKSKLYYDLKANTKYTWGVYIYKNINTSTGSPIQLINSDGTTIISSLEVNNSFMTKTMTPSSDIRIYPRLSVATANVKTQCILFLYEGEKELPFEEYFNYEYCKIGNYEDKFIRTSGKNSFDNSKVEIGKSWHGGSNTNRARFYIEMTAGTQYSIRVDDFTNLNEVAIVETATITSGTAINTEVKTAPFTTTHTLSSGAKYVVIQFQSANTFTQTMADNIKLMLNLGSTALPYEPYGSNEWYIKKNIGKVVFTGANTEGWRMPSTNTNNAVFCNYVNTSIYDFRDMNDTQYSNYFNWKGVGYGYQDALNGGVGMYTNIQNNIYKYVYYVIPLTEASTVEQWYQWLSSHNLEMYYVLANPTYTQITGTLETQLENVYQLLKSYKGVTNISQVNNDLAFELDVEAVEDME